MEKRKTTMREIMARMAVRTYDFGYLVILNDPTIRASVHGPALGRFGETGLLEAVERELAGGKAWTQVRARVEPCRDCVFKLSRKSLTYS